MIVMKNETIYTIVPETIDGKSIGDYTREELVRASFCYLHGELQDRVGGYDIFNMLRSEVEPGQRNDYVLTDEFGPGIYSCICMGEPCTFFRWERLHYKGLVVFNTDKDAYEYASKCYEEKEWSI
jgi:hypothetical protein